MKRVLIIAYYWPPNAGVGTHRWLKFAKYLPGHDWQPVVYTPAHPELQGFDPALEKDVPPEAEVIKAPIMEPYRWYKRFTGRRPEEHLRTAFLSEEQRGGWREELAMWVRGNLFIPDPRICWRRPSVRRLTAYLRERPVDVIVTTGSPHSLHLIGLDLHRRTGIPWLADFRDPWTNIDYYAQLKLTRCADRRHRALERDVLATASRVLTVSWRWAEELQALGARRVEVITNGFDPDDLPRPPEPVDERWSLVHVGSFTATRDVPELWEALALRLRTDGDFRARFTLRFVGGVDHAVLRSVERAGLMPHVERTGQVGHTEALRHMQRARALLLPVNDTPNAMGFLPAKVFEYLAAGRPILAVAPAGADIGRVIGAHGTLVARGDTAAMRAAVEALFGGPIGQRLPSEHLEHYTRPRLTAQLAAVLDGLVR
jgi:glycosyltransferase involved in cell wall biosynthesis